MDWTMEWTELTDGRTDSADGLDGQRDGWDNEWKD